MAIENQIEQSIHGLQGQTPSNDIVIYRSKLHNTSSLNNFPIINRPPTALGLQGQLPEKYTDNLPQ